MKAKKTPNGFDYTGYVFNKLTVLGNAPNTKTPAGQNVRRVKCRCECGKVFHAVLSQIKSETTTSCGCWTLQLQTKHGMYKSRTYRIWSAMKTRCAINSTYVNRGIGVCKRWKDFTNFFSDMGECPEGLTLDRKNNKKGYCKSNCRWATRHEQARNTSRTRKFWYKGEYLCIKDLANKYGINRETLRHRLTSGWEVEKAIMQPSRQKTKIFYAE